MGVSRGVSRGGMDHSWNLRATLIMEVFRYHWKSGTNYRIWLLGEFHPHNEGHSDTIGNLTIWELSSFQTVPLEAVFQQFSDFQTNNEGHLNSHFENMMITIFTQVTKDVQVPAEIWGLTYKKCLALLAPAWEADWRNTNVCDKWCCRSPPLFRDSFL